MLENSSLFEIFSLVITFALGLISGYIINFFRYRSQRRLYKMQRLTPELEGMLGILTRLREHGEDYGRFKINFEGALKTADEMKDFWYKSLVGGIILWKFQSVPSIINECKKFEESFKNLQTSGMFETLKQLDETLSRNLSRVHEVSVYLADEKIEGKELSKMLMKAYDLSRSISDLLLGVKECEDRLRNFLRK